MSLKQSTSIGYEGAGRFAPRPRHAAHQAAGDRAAVLLAHIPQPGRALPFTLALSFLCLVWLGGLAIAEAEGAPRRGRAPASTGLSTLTETEGPSRAGLVVLFDDGTTRKLCVEFGGKERTGEEVLRLSGLEVVADSGPLGSRVCAIEGLGCPREDCWCQCRQPGEDCRYWAYYSLSDGEWKYSAVGAASRTLKHGDVDGWAWGSGAHGSGQLPPVTSFDELCGDYDPSPEPTSPPAATSVPPEQSPGPAPETVAPSDTPDTAASATQKAAGAESGTDEPLPPAASRKPSRTPRPAHSARSTAASRGADSTPDGSVAVQDPTEAPQSSSVVATASAATSGASRGADQTSVAATVRSASTQLAALEAAGLGGTRSPTDSGALADATLVPARRLDPQDRVTPRASSEDGGVAGYVVVFLVVVAVLALGLVASRRSR